MPSAPELVDLAGHYGLALDAASISMTSSGLDFLVAFAADVDGIKWVLRIPRRPDALGRARKEQRILDLVAPHLPVQVPRWKVFSDELIAYHQLPGHPAATVDMEAKAYVWRMDDKHVPAAFERSLAEAVAALHGVDSVKAAAAGLRVLGPEQLRQDMHSRMLRVRSEFGVSPELWTRWQDWLANDSLWPCHTVLVHGDLHAGHILIDDSAKVNGIIDWTEAVVGDPAIDFAGYLTIFGDDAARRFILAYQKAGGRTWPGMFEHVVELCAASGVNIAEFAMSSGLDEYRQMARQAMGVAS
jgi:macrolide phosphotransferase